MSLAFAARVVLARVYHRYESFWGVWILLLLGVIAHAAGLGAYFQRPADLRRASDFFGEAGG